MNVDLTSITQANYLFKMGRHQCFAGDFTIAIKNLKEASIQFLKEKDYEKYLQCQNTLVIMHTEMEQFDAIERIRHELAEIIWSHKQLGANYACFHYSLGFCFLRQKNYIKAQVQLDQALAQNLKLQKLSSEQQDQKKLLISYIDACYISYSFVCLYTASNQIPSAVQELKNMEGWIKRFKSLHTQINNGQTILEQKNSNKDIQALLEYSEDEQHTVEFIYNFSKANILRLEQKYDSAEELYWLCYEQSQRSNRRKYMSLHLLYYLSRNYMAKENYEQASIFLNLAKKTINPNIFKKMHRRITRSLEELKKAVTSNYDMVVNFNDKVIVEKQKGHINIRNQFVLLDMLRLFISNPGTVYSKESLVEKIWKQKYDPRVHDNKIYVTVKRLRELVEPDQKKPKYLFRTKEGYYINNSVKILFK